MEFLRKLFNIQKTIKIENKPADLNLSSAKINRIMNEYKQLDNGQEVMFYVTCKGYIEGGPADRLHIISVENDKVLIEIDKGSDAGTWTKEENKVFLELFLNDIRKYIDYPEQFGFEYEQW